MHFTATKNKSEGTGGLTRATPRVLSSHEHEHIPSDTAAQKEPIRVSVELKC